jgi:hypothetical protein
MCDNAISPMKIMKYVYLYWIYGLVTYASKKTTSSRMKEAQFDA